MKKEYEINEYGLYSVKDITREFDKIIGISWKELNILFYKQTAEIISKDNVIEYCKNNYDNLRESKFKKEIDDNIINKRTSDYDILLKTINIYKNKGMEIIKIFTLLRKDYYSKEFEEYLKELDISHYGNIIVGRDLIRLVEALKNTILKYNFYLEKINNYNTYNTENYDALYIKIANAFPNENILNEEEKEYDKTSLRRTKKKTYKL